MNNAQKADIEVGIHLFFTAIVIWLVMFFLGPFGCHDDCEPDTTRCKNNRPQVCNAETDWEWNEDGKCDEVEDFGEGHTWMCCADPDDGVHACLPDFVCEPDAGVDAGDGGS
jgi:hypothetical protein